MSNRRAAGSGAVFPWRRRNKTSGKLEQVGWAAMVDLGIVDGKRSRQALYAPMDQKKELVARLSAAQHAKDRGMAPKGGRLTVEQWLATWLLSKGAKKPRTLEHYELIVRRHLAPTIGKKPLAKLTPQDVEAMLNAKSKSGLAPRSVAHLRSVLRNSLHRAMRDGLVSRNVAALADPVNVPEEERPALTPEQAEVFLEAVKGDRLEAMYVTALGLGLRQGELFGLRWSDVDFEGGHLTVAQALQWIRPIGGGAGVPTLVQPKSVKSRRTVTMPAFVGEALREHRASWALQKIRLGERWLNEWDLVFVGPFGEPLHPRGLCDEFHAILKAAKLPSIHFHDLRHSCASLLGRHHVPARVVSEILGHASISLTLKTYSHVFAEQHDEAAATMDRLLGGGRRGS